MSKYFTGIDGTLSIDGAVVARARSIQIQGSIGTLDTTTLADEHDTFIQSRRSYNGSCTIYYYEDTNGALSANQPIQNIFGTAVPSKTRTFTFRVNLTGQYKDRVLEFNAYIASISMGLSAGEVLSADITFTVTGPLTLATISDQ